MHRRFECEKQFSTRLDQPISISFNAAVALQHDTQIYFLHKALLFNHHRSATLFYK